MRFAQCVIDGAFARLVIATALGFGTWCGSSLAATGDPVATFTVASNGGTVVLTADRKAYFVPAGTLYASTADGTPAYSGSQSIVNIVPAANGLVTHFSGGGAYFSPDGMNLGGGGWSQSVTSGTQRVVQIRPVQDGVVAAFSGGGVYRSPDGRNLDGAGNTLRSYSGAQQIVSMSAVNGGIVTLFSGGAAYFSPDGLNLGGGGQTVRAYSGPQSIQKIVEVPQGVQTRFSGGATYLSRTGRDLGGAADAVRLPAATKRSLSTGFGPRDSGSITHFDGRLWMSSGFFKSNLSYFDLWSTDDASAGWSMTFGVAEPQVGPVPGFYEPYSPLLSFEGALWAIGSTVWRSVDGMHWDQVAVGPRRAVEDADAFVFRGKMVYVDPQAGQVFVSADGLDWSQRVDIPGFAPRCGAAITAGSRGIFIAGGGGCNYQGYHSDTWFSEDAITWTRLTDAQGAPRSVEWPGRLWPCSVTTPSGIMWVFGGFRIENGVGVNLNDLWFSRNGNSWQRMPVSGTIEPRHAPSCYFDASTNALVVIAGKGGSNPLNDRSAVMNDVTTLELPLDEFLP
jgi:hypothetical protein